jgi:photosystem I P700 chlorophyll a apoprotein A1
MVFSDFSRLWSRVGDFSVALSKGAKTTRWIWNLHSDSHDFESTMLFVAFQLGGGRITRKILSSNIAHIALLFFFISGIHFDGGYFSNHCTWNKDAKDYLAGVLLFSAHTSFGPQDILNSDIGNYFQGIDITCGIFQLWRGEGIITQLHLKYASTGSLVGTIISLTACYFHMHSFC